MKQKQWSTFFLCLLLIFSMIPVTTLAETTQPTIAAEAAILMDADTKTVLYAKNAEEMHYPASITKLMTALLAIENLSPNDILTFSSTAVNSIEYGSSHIGIKADEQLTVDQALHGLLLMSANEVANGLAEAVSGSLEDFAKLMTQRAAELGALNTHFVNANGLHDDNHYTTAYDMALIGSYLAKNDYFLEIMQDKTYQIPETNITDEIRYLYQQHAMLNEARNAQIYREDVIGGKTGYTDQARHTLVTIAKQGDTTLVAVVLQSEKSTLYTDTAALLNYGFDSYQTLNLHTASDIIKTLPCYCVKSGQAYQFANYGLRLVDDASVIVPNNVSPNDIKLLYDLPEYIDPSVQIDDVVGTVSFVLDGKTLLKKDLVVAQIDKLPEPTFAETFTQPFPWFYIAIGGILLVSIILIFGIILYKRHHRKRKYIKLKKLFK